MDRADSRMGHFRVAVQVGHRTGERFEPIEALVDTGATYTWVPREVLERLGVVPEEDWPFILADGREVQYPVACSPQAWAAGSMPYMLQHALGLHPHAFERQLLGDLVD